MSSQDSQNPYEDILHLPRPICRRASRMTNYDRAAQFSPFAALTGYDACIAEAGRLTEGRIELDELRKEELNSQLLALMEQDQPRVTLTHFRYDERKAGGSYVRTTGEIKRIDPNSRCVLFTDGRVVGISNIIAIEQ